MTKADVFVQILHEVTGKSKEEVRTLLDEATAATGRAGFDEELTDEEAEQWLADLRKEKAGIMNWLLRGAQDAGRNEGTA